MSTSNWKLPLNICKKFKRRPRFAYHPISSFGATDSIRILELLPGTGDVCCRLSHARLSENPEYESLSYCWGSDQQQKAILVDETLFLVTANLYMALKRLRHPNLPRFLWIDAICINQADDNERSQQVSIMVQIYGTGQRTLVWLGEDDSRTEKIIQLLKFLARHRGHPSSPMSHRVLQETLDRDEPNHSLKPMLLLDYLSVIPWFTRVWIVQEVAVSHNITVMWGCHEFDWGLLEEADDATHFFLASGFGALRQLRRECLNSDYVRDFQEIVAEHVVRQASDSRDKIYALLGLLPYNVRHGIEPDYTKGVQQVLTDFTVSCLRSDRYLTMLSLAQGCERGPITTRGASWLFLSERDDKFDVPIFYIFGWSDSVRGKLFQASNGSLSSDLHIDLQQNLLTLAGYEFDTIAEICGFHFNFSMVEQKVNATLHDCLIMSTQLSVMLLKWCDMFDLHDSTKITEETAMEKFDLFWQIACCMSKQIISNPDELRRIFYNYASLYFHFKHLPRFNHRDISALHYMHWIVLMCQLRVSKSFRRKLDLDALLPWTYQAKACYNRHLFKTSQGYMGLAPLSAREEDRIVLLQGGRVPFILRKNGSDWLLVGEAYVHGIMDGQAWDEAKCYPIRIR